MAQTFSSIRSGAFRALAIASLSLAGISQAVAVSDYSLDYSESAGGGARSTTADYTVIARTVTSGITNEPATSTDYSTAPPVAVAASSPNSSVRDWSIY